MTDRVEKVRARWERCARCMHDCSRRRCIVAHQDRDLGHAVFDIQLLLAEITELRGELAKFRGVVAAVEELHERYRQLLSSTVDPSPRMERAPESLDVHRGQKAK